VEFSKDSKTAWASAEIGGTVHIIDVEKLEQIHEMSFKVPGVNQDRVQPVGIELTSNGKYAFVALGPSNHVAVVDAKTYEVLDYLLVGSRVWQLDLNKDETQLYTTNGVSGDVSVIDLEGMKVIKSIKVGRYPWGVVIDPNS
jgi:YVTN family beta-propeller protein